MTHHLNEAIVSGAIAFFSLVPGLVEPAQCETVEQLAAMEISLHTGNPITVAEKGREDELYFAVANPEGVADVRFRLHLAMTDYDGRKFDWISDALSVASGKSVEIPLAEVIPAVGWWRICPTIRAADADIAAAKPTRELAYIDPVGPCDLPPEEGFWFGLDSRVRSSAMLRLLAQMGVNIIRFGTWAGVNPAENEFAWEPFDEVVDTIREYGMQTLYSVTFTPAYAVKPEYRGKGDPSRLPPRPEVLREALHQIIGHTRSKGLAIYDLWNEPDHRGFWRGSTEDHLEFMRVAYATIKSVQPDATVLSGGIASLHQGRFDGLNPDMDRRILLEGQNCYDAIALHEHGTFERFAEALDGPLTEYRKRLTEPKSLWLTETGHNGDAHDKAAVLVQKYTYARAHGAKGLVWYALYPPGQGGDYNIIDAQGDPQPAIPAYNQMVRMMRGKRFVRAFEDGTQSGNRLVAFSDEEQTLLVAWGRGATAYRAPVVLADGAEAQAFDMMGRRLMLERSGNTIFVPFARTPRYLQISGRVDVRDYEKITPLSLYAFGSLEPSACARHVSVSPLEAIGWTRRKLDDQDARMAESTSGHPNGMFDGDGNAMQLRFTISPTDGAVMDIDNLSFWGNAGASSETIVTLTYQVADAATVDAGSRQLRNLASPRIRGEYFTLPLSGLDGVKEPVIFTLTANRDAKRVILKIDDLRVDGHVAMRSTVCNSGGAKCPIGSLTPGASGATSMHSNASLPSASAFTSRWHRELQAMRPRDRRWTASLPLRPVAMVVADDTLVYTGPPDLANLIAAQEAIEGKHGGLVWILKTSAGQKRAELRLSTPPVHDGLAVAQGHCHCQPARSW